MPHPELSSPLYHGSTARVANVDVTMGAPRKDFGAGFYTTSGRRRAEHLAVIKASCHGLHRGTVSVYEYRNDPALDIRWFDAPDVAWLEFVLFNRGFDGATPTPADAQADLLIGPVANDAVGLVLNQLLIGTYGDPASNAAKTTAIRLLELKNLHNQIFFRTRRAAACLTLKDAYAIDR
jgi:hypothetical protein